MQDGWDFIGDTHGYADQLLALLQRLGYQPRSAGGWRHPQGRRVLFLGDYIDQGPAIAQVLATVRAMVSSGDALAIMGNHEFNALAWNTVDAAGQPLRPHTRAKQAQHQATLDQIGPVTGELNAWLRELPLWIEHPDGWRAIHAAWVPNAMAGVSAALERHGGLSDGFLGEAMDRSQALFDQTEIVLKGLEIDLPEGVVLTDHYGTERSTTRAQWWQAVAPTTTVAEVALPPGVLTSSVAIGAAAAAAVPGYPAEAPPLFCGHYRLRTEPVVLAPNVACCDYSAGPNERPLRAYRWDGEAELSADKFV